jgi:hypothetical protein
VRSSPSLQSCKAMNANKRSHFGDSVGSVHLEMKDQHFERCTCRLTFKLCLSDRALALVLSAMNRQAQTES